MRDDLYVDSPGVNEQLKKMLAIADEVARKSQAEADHVHACGRFWGTQTPGQDYEKNIKPKDDACWEADQAAAQLIRKFARDIGVSARDQKTTDGDSAAQFGSFAAN